MKPTKCICLIAATALSAAVFCSNASAQFKEQAFSQQYNNDTAASADSTEALFSFKEYFAGLKSKSDLKIGTLAGGSALVIGGMQIYNDQKWKLPITYGLIGAGVGSGLYFRSQDNTKAATWCFAGAGVAYWGTLMDGVVNYKPADYPHAGKATLYSLLIPGLGQIYNHEYWKVPIYLGGMAFAVHYRSDCARNFERFKSIYADATENASTYDGPISAEQAKYYKNSYRRYRDYSTLAIALLYLLQAIDANVFSYMHNFEVDEDLSMRFSPTLILPEGHQFASVGNPTALGMKLGFTF